MYSFARRNEMSIDGSKEPVTCCSGENSEKKHGCQKQKSKPKRKNRPLDATSDSMCTAALPSADQLTRDKQKLEVERCMLIQSGLERGVDRKYFRKFNEIRVIEQNFECEHGTLKDIFSSETGDNRMFDDGKGESIKNSCNTVKNLILKERTCFPNIKGNIETIGHAGQKRISKLNKYDPAKLPRIDGQGANGRKISISQSKVLLEPLPSVFSPSPSNNNLRRKRRSRSSCASNDQARNSVDCSTPESDVPCTHSSQCICNYRNKH
ncbi:hypothetical protein CHS0354_031970 [Potamilus streckersoni]|uniref:Uncharacterized protein n=1 Tax=Potamilus streckersoni TaxID=2493646 RepID=A0AAE0WH92_9BIVA|nr:hypothetical protein CHS0354_031970 [Potamilus streckersoni]